MKVLLTGATGFIGQRLLRRLLDAGHEVLCVGRHPPPQAVGQARCQAHALDFAQAVTPAHWTPLLPGVDAVVNTVGIFREQGPAQRFEVLHTEAPCALFTACAAAGVQRVVQLSALGASADARTPYHRSKHAGDACLLVLPGLDAAVVQPSLVFGAEGASSRMFLMLATLPLWLLPGGGRQPVQPVHVDDLVQILGVLALAPPGALQHLPSRRIAVVGPAPMTLAEYLQALRQGLGLPGPHGALLLPLPARVADLLARVGDHLPGALFTRDSWAMLQQGNTAPAADTTRLLERPPRAPADFVPAPLAGAWRTQALLRWLLPLLRGSIALVWLWTALVSAGLYPVADSRALLARAGVPEGLQALALYGAAGLDLLLGVLTLWPVGRGRWRLPHRRWLWRMQALLIAAYTLIITWHLPAFWLHPYGPVLKNLPMLAVLLLLHAFEPPARPAMP